MILKKQLHLDIETIYIMFFEGFLGAKQKPITGNILTQSEIGAVISSYIASNKYSLFEGTTQSSREGGWYGFKHANTGIVIYMTQKLLPPGGMPLFYIILKGTTVENTTVEYYYF